MSSRELARVTLAEMILARPVLEPVMRAAVIRACPAAPARSHHAQLRERSAGAVLEQEAEALAVVGPAGRARRTG